LNDGSRGYREALARWRAKQKAQSMAAASPAGAPEREAPSQGRGRYAGGYDPPDLFGPDTLEDMGFDPLRDLGFPGEPPFTRGPQREMYRSRLWTMRQYAGFGTAEESNARFRYLLNRGQTGISIAFDLPTQMGRDSDHPQASGEVGRVGVAIDTLDDMRRLLSGLPLATISTSMTINATAAILLCFYVAVAEEQGIARSALRGTLQNDILKEYVARGTYIYPPEPSLRLIRDIFAFASAEMPKWNTISISGYHMREAGCDAVQEVAFTLASGVSYVQSAVEAGLDVDTFGAQLSFFFNGHNNVLEEVAKFRAARKLWSELMATRFGAKTDRARALRFHCQTAGMTLTAQQPLNNVVRVALQAMAAVYGGAQSLHTNSYDEALGLPTEQAATIALRTQQIIAHESGAADFVDPLAGSYVVEALTHRIVEGSRSMIERIDALGGMVRAIEQGFVQREIQASAYAYQLDIESKRRVIVGVNAFASESAKVPVTQIDPRLEAEQVQRLSAFKAARDAALLARQLERLAQAVRSNDNLVRVMLDAVRAGATVGEISDVLRDAWGEYVAPSSF
jgi:methylmalonyl-CoA mutase N-terminal domain/subunit